jgi:hypothetical protein
VFLLFIQINYTLFRYYQMLLILMDPFNLIFIELIIYMILYMIVNIMILLLILELGLMYMIVLFLYLGMMFSNVLRLEYCCYSLFKIELVLLVLYLKHFVSFLEIAYIYSYIF